MVAYEHCVTINYQVMRIETSLQCKSFSKNVFFFNLNKSRGLSFRGLGFRGLSFQSLRSEI